MLKLSIDENKISNLKLQAKVNELSFSGRPQFWRFFIAPSIFQAFSPVYESHKRIKKTNGKISAYIPNNYRFFSEREKCSARFWAHTISNKLRVSSLILSAIFKSSWACNNVCKDIQTLKKNSDILQYHLWIMPFQSGILCPCKHDKMANS